MTAHYPLRWRRTSHRQEVLAWGGRRFVSAVFRGIWRKKPRDRWRAAAVAARWWAR